MRTHDDIDRRSLALAFEIVRRIDADPRHNGLEMARATCARWLRESPGTAIREWQAILTQDWPVSRSVLLDAGQEGRRLRQSSPFCGILSARERWAIYRRFRHESQAT